MKKGRFTLLVLIIGLISILLLSCSKENPSLETASPDEGGPSAQITVKGDGIFKEITYAVDELKALPDAEFAHIYSSINNWPAKKTYAASGIKVTSILKAAGVLDSMESVTFRAADGYECVLTKNQLSKKRYYFPHLDKDSPLDAQPVEAIIADKYREDSSDLSEIMMGPPTLFFGQENIFEHNNPAFVQNVTEIIVSAKPSERWETATTFPAEGKIPAGERVKLQHSSFGRVKLYYTLDGKDPTLESAMYNPSTFQPELNKPIKIKGDTVIKIIVAGYGKDDSEIASYRFSVSP